MEFSFSRLQELGIALHQVGMAVSYPQEDIIFLISTQYKHLGVDDGRPGFYAAQCDGPSPRAAVQIRLLYPLHLDIAPCRPNNLPLPSPKVWANQRQSPMVLPILDRAFKGPLSMQN